MSDLGNGCGGSTRSCGDLIEISDTWTAAVIEHVLQSLNLMLLFASLQALRMIQHCRERLAGLMSRVFKRLV